MYSSSGSSSSGSGSEQGAGAGRTTFEYQLDAFVNAIRRSRGEAGAGVTSDMSRGGVHGSKQEGKEEVEMDEGLRAMVVNADIIDKVLEAAGVPGLDSASPASALFAPSAPD